MDASYAPSGFAEPPPAPPASAAAQTPAPAWAYEPRVPAAASSPSCSGSSPSLKASLSYEEGHPPQSEPDIIQRPTFAASHQLSGYATTPQPTGLSGVFDTSVISGSANTKDSSMTDFLSSVESGNAQAASSGTLLPQFRAPSWQTGLHSSAATELFVTGPLPTTGTLPPTSLSAYQHPATFSNRNFVTTSPLVLQDSTFNTTSNGILNPHDPLLQIKTSQGTVPTALAFERLGSSALSNSIPPQSSTYRSAQESAPHLLQPQFSLLPSALGGAQQMPQAYSSTLFTSSTASIERALLRECSVIKHHQRPSGTQSIQAQLTGPQHSLHSYLSNASISNFQETSRQSSLSCSPIGDSTQVSNGGLQQKTPQVSVELAQSYSSVIPSSGYPPSTTKVDGCSTKQPLMSTKIPKPQSIIPPAQTLNYSKPLHNQSSVVSGQAQIYSTAQLPSLLSVSQSQNYGLVQPHNVPSIVHSQVYRSSRVEKLPSLYKTLTFSGSSQPVTSENQTLSFSSAQQEVLSSVTNENYPAQTRDLSSVSQSQSYSSGHSQGLSPVSQTQVSYSSQSQVLSVVSPSESYASGPSLTLTAPSLSYSSASRAQNLPNSSPTPNYISMHSSQNAQTQGSSSPQPQKFLPALQSSFAPSTHGQTLQNSIPSPDPKSYAERKLDSNVYTSSKQEDDFPMQKLQALQSQASLESSSQRLSDAEMNSQESIYKTSKADDRYPQSVIRNNSHLEDQVVGVALQGSKKEENIIGSVTQLNQQIGQPNSVVTPDLKKATNLMQTPQIRLNAKDLNNQHSLVHKGHDAKVQEQHDQIINTSSQIQIPDHALGHDHQASLPNTQVLLDSACDLQILQHSILQAGLGQAKASLQVQRVQSPQQMVHPFLQMDGHIIQSNGDHSQQQLHPQNSEMMKIDLPESSKPLQQLTTKGPFSDTGQHDPKNQFVSLGSICFPEAMLLSDERNILSNVDDILAATAAACGVTPSDFSKSPSNETMQAVEGGDSKSHFQQSLDVRHVNSDFNSITATVGKPQNINDISLNGNQVTINLSPVPTLSSKTILDQQHIEAPSQNIPTKVPSTVVGPSHEIQEQSSGPFKKQTAMNHESKEDSEAAVNGALSNTRNQEFVSSNRSISRESAASESEFPLVGDDGSMSVNHTRSTLALLSMAQPGDAANSKTEEENQDLIHFNLPKKKTKGKGQIKEEDDNQKPLKRPTQGKRQNPRGADIYLPYAPPSSESCHEGYQHQEKMRQKIKEVEEKQPEVKTGFIASFLDFLKCGPKQQFSTLAVRMPNRTRRPGTQIARTFCPPSLPKTSSTTPAALVSEIGGASPSEKVDNELKNLEHLSSLSSDEEDPGMCSHEIYKSVSTPLTALDATSDKSKKTEALPVAAPSPAASTTGTASSTSTTVSAVKQDLLHSTSSAVKVLESISSTEHPTAIELDGLASDQFAKGQDTVAIEGFTDEENIESGGEGQYRERDEFVVKIEDIETFKEALKIGKEPPAIWKVQKALLQKFVPEIRDGQREFAATNSYLGYFGDAKTKYKRIYVKFIENANKKEYVRVCSKKPRNKPSQTIRNVQTKPSSSSKTSDPPLSKTTVTKASSTKPKVKQLKIKAEPPPKKRKKWKEEFSSSQSESSPEVHSNSSEDEEFDPPAPFVTRFLNTRAMKETFKSYMELLVSIALDPDTMQALEKSNDELLLPHMKKIDGMLNDNRKRLLLNLHLDQSFKNALESFPELTIITRDAKAKSGGAAISKIKMNGKTYNKKTLRTSKTTTKSSQEFAVDPEKIQLYSLYHSLHHYKYHVYLICKDEISSVQKKNEDLGQEEIVQLCMKNVKWVEDLFEKFGDLLNHVQQKCS